MCNSNSENTENSRLKITFDNFDEKIQLGAKAPKFSASSTMGNISLDNYLGKWLVFFSHPGDFTPV